MLLAALVLAGCAGRDVYSGRIYVDGVHTIAAGETIDGDMLVFNGEITLEQGSRVSGSVYMLSGELQVDGRIDGNLSLIGGTLNLGPQSSVGGALNKGGGQVVRSPSAEISGEVNTGLGIEIPLDLEREEQPLAQSLGGVAFRSLLLAGLGCLVVRFLPQPVRRVRIATREHPVICAAMGLLVMIVIPVLLVVMAFTVILIPLTLLGLVLLAVLVVYGWTAIGWRLGRLLMRLLKREVSTGVSVFWGMLAWMWVVELLDYVPVVGFFLLLLAIAVALGAVLLTRLGFQRYVPTFSWDEGIDPADFE